jgi:curved DNA-binding protein CbpA
VLSNEKKRAQYDSLRTGGSESKGPFNWGGQQSSSSSQQQ